jgi:SAM-dependent methyltransferase
MTAPHDGFPPPGHPLRFTTIAHRDRRILGPFDEPTLAAFVDDLPVRRDGVAFDVACGKGALLIELAHRRAVSGLGVDRNPWFLAEGRDAARAAKVADLVELREGELGAETAPLPGDAADLASCVGASGVFGGRRETLDALARVARPDGLVLVGEGYLRRPLTDAENAEFGIGEDEMTDIDGTIATGTALGLESLGSLLATEPEWDAYETAYAGAIDRWVAEEASSDDPDRERFVERAAFMRDTYARWRREAMGFGLFVFRRPR